MERMGSSVLPVPSATMGQIGPLWTGSNFFAGQIPPVGHELPNPVLSHVSSFAKKQDDYLNMEA